MGKNLRGKVDMNLKAKNPLHFLLESLESMQSFLKNSPSAGLLTIVYLLYGNLVSKFLLGQHLSLSLLKGEAKQCEDLLP